MHHSEKILTVILCWFPVWAHSQHEPVTLDVEKNSFELYSQSKWDQLITFTNQVLRKGYDYFYLRYRLGMAYYTKGQYRLASLHFKKALAWNSDDAATQAYLYYSLLFSGQIDEARHLSRYLGADAAGTLNVIKRSSVNFTTAEGGIKIPNNDAFGAAVYSQVNLAHTVHNRLGLLHAVNTYHQTEARGTISQWQYFIQASVPLGKGWNFSPSLHSVNLNFKSGSATAAEAKKFNDFVISGMLSKSTPYADFSVGGGYSTVLVRPQYLQFATLSLYPRGKPDFSFGATLYAHQNNTKDAIVPAWKLSSDFAISPYLYFTLSPRLVVGLNYFRNTNYNISELNGYFVNNSTDITQARYGTTFSFAISPQWELNGLYAQEEKQAGASRYSYSIFSVGLRFKPL